MVNRAVFACFTVDVFTTVCLQTSQGEHFFPVTNCSTSSREKCIDQITSLSNLAVIPPCSLSERFSHTWNLRQTLRIPYELQEKVTMGMNFSKPKM